MRRDGSLHGSSPSRPGPGARSTAGSQISAFFRRTALLYPALGEPHLLLQLIGLRCPMSATTSPTPPRTGCSLTVFPSSCCSSPARLRGLRGGDWAHSHLQSGPRRTPLVGVGRHREAGLPRLPRPSPRSCPSSRLQPQPGRTTSPLSLIIQRLGFHPPDLARSGPSPCPAPPTHGSRRRLTPPLSRSLDPLSTQPNEALCLSEACPQTRRLRGVGTYA